MDDNLKELLAQKKARLKEKQKGAEQYEQLLASSGYGLGQLDTSNPVLIPVVDPLAFTSSSVLTVLRSGAKGQRV